MMGWAVLSLYATLALMVVGGLLAGRRYEEAAGFGMGFAVLLGLFYGMSFAPAFR
jgi:hypothetical protein